MSPGQDERGHRRTQLENRPEAFDRRQDSAFAGPEEAVGQAQESNIAEKNKTPMRILLALNARLVN